MRHLISALLLSCTLPAFAAPSPLPTELPATFVGTLPCADFPGIDTKLNLLPDGQFQMRMTYLERPGAGFDSIGLWQVKDGKLTLTQGEQNGEQTVEQFQVKSKPATLIKLDMEGKPIASKLNYSLTPKGIFQPMKPTLTLQGTFVYLADSARFTPCATGKSMPVKMEDDYLALEKAYMSARQTPQQVMLATVEGQISKQPRTEGEGSEQVLRVKKFVSLDKASACPVSSSTPTPAAEPAALLDRTWNLVQLGDKTIPPAKDERQSPHIVLSSQDQRVSGSGGCNRLMGGYTLDGDKLRFSKMASTMMMCEEQAQTEHAFLQSLDKVARFSLQGDALTLWDEAGNALARLRAVASKP